MSVDLVQELKDINLLVEKNLVKELDKNFFTDEVNVLLVNYDEESDVILNLRYRDTFIKTRKKYLHDLGSKYSLFEIELVDKKNMLNREEFSILINRIAAQVERFSTKTSGFDYSVLKSPRKLMFDYRDRNWTYARRFFENAYSVNLFSPLGNLIREKYNPARNGRKSQTAERAAAKLSYDKIALISIYSNNPITRENAPAVAREYQLTAKSAGEKLYQRYTHYQSNANRRGRPDPFTRTKLKNKIDRIGGILDHLDEIQKKNAMEDMEHLSRFYDSGF
jgi:hypothetical protein